MARYFIEHWLNVFNREQPMSAVNHWNHQRFSAVVLALTLPWLGWVLTEYGACYYNLIDYFHSPLTITGLTLCVLSILYHGFLGYQVVVEDYIHNKAWRYFFIKAAQLKIFTLGIFCLFCIIKIFIAGN